MSDKKPVPCGTCGGTGIVYVQVWSQALDGYRNAPGTCSACKGTGKA